MSRRRTLLLALTLLCVGLLLGGRVWAEAAAAYAIQWQVIAAGGGHSQSASYRVEGTLGQAAIGPSSSAAGRLGGGYWYGMADTVVLPEQRYRTYLPVILKGHR